MIYDSQQLSIKWHHFPKTLEQIISTENLISNKTATDQLPKKTEERASQTFLTGFLFTRVFFSK